MDGATCRLLSNTYIFDRYPIIHVAAITAHVYPCVYTAISRQIGTYLLTHRFTSHWCQGSPQPFPAYPPSDHADNNQSLSMIASSINRRFICVLYRRKDFRELVPCRLPGRGSFSKFPFHSLRLIITGSKNLREKEKGLKYLRLKGGQGNWGKTAGGGSCVSRTKNPMIKLRDARRGDSTLLYFTLLYITRLDSGTAAY